MVVRWLVMGVFVLASLGCGGGGGGSSGGGGGSGGAPSTAVDAILNGPAKGQGTSCWDDPLGFVEDRWAFYADGTGAFQGRDAGGVTLLNMDITWTRNGPDSISIAPIQPRPQGLTLTAIAGGVAFGEFTATQNGNPSVRIWGLIGQGLPGAPGGVGSGTLVITDSSNSSVRIFDRATLTEQRTISGGNTEINAPVGVAVDRVRGEIYVANAGSNAICVHALSSDGNVAPLRRIAGAATGLSIHGFLDSYPTHIAVDAANGEVFIACQSSIRVWPRTANGDVAPARVIAGPNTTLGQGLDSAGAIAVDVGNNELFVGDAGAVRVFARSANGDAAPLRILTSSLQGQFRALAVDATNGELWVGRTAGNSTQRMEVFSRTAMGGTAPLRSATWGRSGIDVDTATGDIANLPWSAPGRVEIIDASFSIRVFRDVGGQPTDVALGP